MTREKREKPRKPQSVKRSEFKPNMRSATAVVSAIAFLQKTGFQATVKNVKKCIAQRCRKPVDHIIGTVPSYLTRGVELGILRKHGVVYKLGSFDLRTRRKKRSRKISSGRNGKQKSAKGEGNTAEPGAQASGGVEFDVCAF